MIVSYGKNVPIKPPQIALNIAIYIAKRCCQISSLACKTKPAQQKALSMNNATDSACALDHIVGAALLNAHRLAT